MLENISLIATLNASKTTQSKVLSFDLAENQEQTIRFLGEMLTLELWPLEAGRPAPCVEMPAPVMHGLMERWDARIYDEDETLPFSLRAMQSEMDEIAEMVQQGATFWFKLS